MLRDYIKPIKVCICNKNKTIWRKIRRISRVTETFEKSDTTSIHTGEFTYACLAGVYDTDTWWIFEEGNIISKEESPEDINSGPRETFLYEDILTSFLCRIIRRKF